ncbi:NAD(P)H-dependent oxidoreductase [Yinghuangia sp. ASG 101]|uniref:NADPH-dependent FMN reductase n=1 Tax=Yinghuangia sp. ASG 101 TaxID=2896848 RepID=UPI001E49E3BA|nr:NAD(P)H-dependent oxidoreductase [Yinghuangia sp. ASG 101]UGQ11376.1 NAD(P)H-dependent oxidoreductase [Yinghuangia sp. ASG 101]
MTKIGIILGSTRPGRVGAQVAAWAAETAAKHGHTDVELVDLAEQALPVFDEPRSPLTGSYAYAHTRAWSARIAAFDAYVFVTPEYNRSMPSVLKNAIDYLYREWNDKAAGIVSYGSAAGGARAAEQLRLVAGALHMPVVRTEVNLSLATDFEAFTTFTPAERQAATLQQLLTEVVAWSDALAPLRRA